MHDLGQRRKLERSIDELMNTIDLEVVAIATQAREALDARKWGRAVELEKRARAKFTPPRSLAKILVDKGGMASMAQARRTIQGGAVNVDGVRARKWDVVIRPGQKVEFKGKVLVE